MKEKKLYRKEVRVARVGDNGKKINLPKIVWETLELEVGDTVELVIHSKSKEVVLKKK